MSLTFDQLYAALNDPSVYNQGAKTVTLAPNTLGSGSIAAVFSHPLNITALHMQNVDQLAKNDALQTVTIHGTTTVAGYTNVEAYALFSIANSDGGAQEAQMVLTLVMAANWTWPTQYNQLNNSVFGTMALAHGETPTPYPAMIVSSYTHPAQGVQNPYTLQTGLNFYTLAASANPPYNKLKLLFGFDDLEFAGTVQLEPLGPHIVLQALNEMLITQLFSVHPPLKVQVSSQFVQGTKEVMQYVGMYITMPIVISGQTITLSTFLTQAPVSMLNLTATFDNLALPSPNDLATFFGGDNLRTSLPDKYQSNPDSLLYLKQVEFEIGVAPIALGMAALTIGTKDNAPWTIIDKWLTIENINLVFTVYDPFGKLGGRHFTTALFATLQIPDGKDDNKIIASLDVFAYYDSGFGFRANLTPNTTFNLTDLLGRFLPQVSDAPALVFDELGLEADVTKRQFSFFAALENPFAFQIGPNNEPISLDYIAFQLDNYSNNGGMGGQLAGRVNFLGVVSAFSYTLPGNFIINTNIPSFEVSLGDLVNKLSGAGAPSWMPSFTFPQTSIFFSRQAIGDNVVYDFALLAQPSWGAIALKIKNDNGVWGFAAGFALNAIKISEAPGLSGLHMLDDVFELAALTMVFSTLPNPAALIPTNTSFPNPYPGIKTIQIPSQASSDPGVYIYGDVKIGSGQTQSMIAKLFGLDASVDLRMSLFLGPDPATNSRIWVGITGTIGHVLVAGQFGLSVKGEVITFFLTASAQVTIEGSQVVFSVEAAFVENGLFIEAAMQTITKPVRIGPVQLGNLALVVGCDFEGIPSVGFAATLDVGANLNSSIALFFDSAIPENSMAAGSISDFTLKDVVDTLAGAIGERPPADLDEMLGEIGISGTGAFSVTGADAGKLIAALNNLNFTTIAALVNQYGKIVISPLPTQNLLSQSNDQTHWYLTDMTTMKHYEFVQKSTTEVDVSLDAQFYLAPEDVTIGTLPPFKAGYRLNGRVDIFAFHASFDLEIQTNKGFTLAAEMDRLVIGSDKFLVISGYGGQGNPEINIATYTDNTRPIAKFQPPHIYITGDIELLGVIGAEIYLSASTKDGVQFAFDSHVGTDQTGNYLGFSLNGHFKAIDNFGGGGTATAHIGTIDLGILGKIPINSGISGTLEMSVSPGSSGPVITVTMGAQFELFKHTFIIPTFSLDIDGASLKNLFQVFYDKIKQTLRDFLNVVDNWLDWVRNKLIEGVEDIGRVLRDFFGYITSEIWGEDDGVIITTIRQQLTKSQAGSITITPGPGVPQDVVDRVTAWANQQLENEVLRVVNISRSSFTPGDADQFNMSLVQSFIETYTESMVIPWFLNPTAAVPSLTSLGFSLQDPRFYEVVSVRQFSVTAQANIDFTVVQTAHLTLQYPTLPQANNTVTFTGSGQSFVFAAPYDDGAKKQYTLQYEVIFVDPKQPAFQSSPFTSDDPIIVLNPGEIGIQHVTFDATNVQWSDVDHIVIDFHFLNTAQAANPINQQFTLTKGNVTESISGFYNTPIANPYIYTATYTLTDKTTYTAPSVTNNAKYVYINSPIQTQLVNVIGVGLSAAPDNEQAIQEIACNVVYQDPDGKQVTEPVTLTPSSMRATVPLKVINQTSPPFTYSATVIYQNGNVVNVPDTTTTNFTVLLGNVNQWFSVQISFALLNWTQDNLEQVNLTLYTLQNGQQQNALDFLLRPDTPVRYWGYRLAQDTTPMYYWAATYYYTNGTSKSISQQQSQNPILSLPSQPPG